jgi:hypothetical protein
MNHPAASSGVSIKDLICLIVPSDEVLDLALRNKNFPKALPAVPSVVHIDPMEAYDNIQKLRK